MTTRKLNALELRVHQAALSHPEKILSQKELVALAPDVTTRTEALNFLLGTGMLKALTRSNGLVSAYRAVMKKEMDVKKDMSGEEIMVLGHIQAAANKGIWTKHLKAKTELHQTVIDRCLKSLLQKQLVKVVKSVEHRTRKMYMLSHLEPAVELTGGPWYTDNELDTEFIKNLYDTILHYIREHSFPKQKRSEARLLYPISAAPSYPTSQQIQTFVSKSKITDTRLTVEHVEMLLNILLLDGEIEKVPAFGAALWESNFNMGEDDETEEDRPRMKRKRKYDKEKDQRKSKRPKRSEHADSDLDDDENTRKNNNKRRRKDDDANSSDSDNHDKRKKKRRTNDSEVERLKGKKKSKKPPESTSSASTSSSEPNSEDEDTRSRRSRKSPRKRSASPIHQAGYSSGAEEAFGGTHVYRAIRQEKVALGWSQAPCGRCPVFDFCKDKGPVNPTECSYFGEWMGNGTIAFES